MDFSAPLADPGLTPEHYQAIGKFALLFNRLEGTIEICISALLDTPDQTAVHVVLDRAMFKSKIEMLDRLVTFQLKKVRGPKTEKDALWKEALSACLKMGGFRNDLVHARWKLPQYRAAGEDPLRKARRNPHDGRQPPIWTSDPRKIEEKSRELDKTVLMLLHASVGLSLEITNWRKTSASEE